MALSVTYTQADVDALKAAIVSGVVTVSYAGPPARTVTYQSIAEMRSTLAQILAASAHTDGTRVPFRLAVFDKGF